MKTSFLSERTSRAVLFSLLALGATTEAQACPCGCVKICVDNLADRPAITPATPFVLDVRFDAIDQNERNDAAHAHWYGSHFLTTATVETQLGGQTWTLSVPRVERHLHTDKTAVGATNYTQNLVGLGDISLGTRFAWSGFTVNVGAKLPTGNDEIVFADPDGGLSRRYLQPGTGSTDVLAGVRKDFGATDSTWSEFVQFQAQGAVASDVNFRPGTTISLGAGVRYKLSENLAVSLQGSLLRQFRDKNTMRLDPTTQRQAAAPSKSVYDEDLESGGLTTSLAAGLSYKFSGATSAYLFYSQPVETRNYVAKSATSLVNPVHATAIWSLGLLHSF
jgi:opacity protein-like surface antigen